MVSPVLAEFLRACFIERRSHRYIGLFLLSSCIAATIVWPGGLISHYLRFSRSPPAFGIMAVVILAGVSVIAMRFSMHLPGSFYSIREWFMMTPVTPLALFAGKWLGGGIHVVILTAFSMPFLVVTASASGIAITSTGVFALIVFATGHIIESAGRAMTYVTDRNRFAAILTMAVCLAVFLFGSLRMFPRWSPFVALQTVQTDVDGAYGFCYRFLAASVVIDVASLIGLAFTRRRLNRRIET